MYTASSVFLLPMRMIRNQKLRSWRSPLRQSRFIAWEAVTTLGSTGSDRKMLISIRILLLRRYVREHHRWFIPPAYRFGQIATMQRSLRDRGGFGRCHQIHNMMMRFLGFGCHTQARRIGICRRHEICLGRIFWWPYVFLMGNSNNRMCAGGAL